MNFPVALIVVAVIAAVCFERYLHHQTAPKIEDRMLTQEKAIQNLAQQVTAEISKLKDRMGTMQLQTGIRSKPPEAK